MIYLKKTTETQNIYIPRQSVLGSAYVETVKDYEDGYNEGFTKGREYQKDQLLNLYVTENGEYSREDGYGVITVDIPTEGGDCSDAYEEGKRDGYIEGYEDGLDNCPECPSISLENGSFTASENGEYTITPSEGFDGLESLNLTVNVEGSSCNIGDLYATFEDYRGDGRWWRYAKEEGLDGFKYVEINASDYGLSKYNEGYSAGKAEGGDCPELTSIDIIENGTYEGAYNVVNVNVPQESGDCSEAYDKGFEDGYNQGQAECPEGGSCNLEDKWVYPSMSDRDNNGFIVVNPSEGYDGLSRTVIDPQTIYNEGKDSIKNTLTTLDVTENGTYTSPITPILIFDGDDKFGFAYADTVNAIEFKIKVNGEGWIFGNETAGIFARSQDTLEIYWFGYEGLTNEYIENEYNTFVLKPYDSKNRLVINGIDRSDLLTEREWSTDGTDFYLGGDGHFNFVYAKFWSEYSQYNKEEKPLFYTIPNTDGNAKTSTYSGEFEVLTNIGGGACQYTEIKECYGYDTVNVNVNVTSKLGDLKEIIDTDIFERYASNDGYDGYSHIYLDASQYGQTKYNEGYMAGEATADVSNLYYCPLIVSDTGFGENARNFTIDKDCFYNADLKNLDTVLYLPTSNNENEVRTNEETTIINGNPFSSYSTYIGKFIFTDMVKEVSFKGEILTNLSSLEIGSGITTFNFSDTSLPNLNKLIVHTNYNVGPSLTITSENGTLYINEDNVFKDAWINLLPSSWTVEYL